MAELGGTSFGFNLLLDDLEGKDLNLYYSEVSNLRMVRWLNEWNLTTTYIRTWGLTNWELLAPSRVWRCIKCHQYIHGESIEVNFYLQFCCNGLLHVLRVVASLVFPTLYKQPITKRQAHQQRH